MRKWKWIIVVGLATTFWLNCGASCDEVASTAVAAAQVQGGQGLETASSSDGTGGPLAPSTTTTTIIFDRSSGASGFLVPVN